MRRDALQQFLRPGAPRTQQEAAICTMQHGSAIALQRKEQRRIRRDAHLLVIARPMQGVAALQQRLIQLRRAVCCFHQQRLSNGVQLIVKRIHQYQAGARQKSRE